MLLRGPAYPARPRGSHEGVPLRGASMIAPPARLGAEVYGAWTA